MIKNIIFDWSGVVKDTVVDHLQIVNKIFSAFGASPISLAEFKDNWVQPYMSFYNKYLPDVSREQESALYKEMIMKCPPAQPYPGIIEVIKDCQQAGLKLAVISSDLPETLLPEIINFGLEEVFTDIITDIDHKQATLDNLLAKHQFDKSETIIIGDSNHEIEVGQNIGIRTVAVTWGFVSEDRLAALQPDFMIHNVAELRGLLFNYLK